MASSIRPLLRWSSWFRRGAITIIVVCCLASDAVTLHSQINGTNLQSIPNDDPTANSTVTPDWPQATENVDVTGSNTVNLNLSTYADHVSANISKPPFINSTAINHTEDLTTVVSDSGTIFSESLDISTQEHTRAEPPSLATSAINADVTETSAEATGSIPQSTSVLDSGNATDVTPPDADPIATSWTTPAPTWESTRESTVSESADDKFTLQSSSTNLSTTIDIDIGSSTSISETHSMPSSTDLNFSTLSVISSEPSTLTSNGSEISTALSTENNATLYTPLDHDYSSSVASTDGQPNTPATVQLGTSEPLSTDQEFSEPVTDNGSSTSATVNDDSQTTSLNSASTVITTELISSTPIQTDPDFSQTPSTEFDAGTTIAVQISSTASTSERTSSDTDESSPLPPFISYSVGVSTSYITPTLNDGDVGTTSDSDYDSSTTSESATESVTTASTSISPSTEISSVSTTTGNSPSTDIFSAPASTSNSPSTEISSVSTTTSSSPSTEIFSVSTSGNVDASTAVFTNSDVNTGNPTHGNGVTASANTPSLTNAEDGITASTYSESTISTYTSYSQASTDYNYSIQTGSDVEFSTESSLNASTTFDFTSATSIDAENSTSVIITSDFSSSATNDYISHSSASADYVSNTQATTTDDDDTSATETSQIPTSLISTSLMSTYVGTITGMPTDMPTTDQSTYIGQTSSVSTEFIGSTQKTTYVDPYTSLPTDIQSPSEDSSSLSFETSPLSSTTLYSLTASTAHFSNSSDSDTPSATTSSMVAETSTYEKTTKQSSGIYKLSGNITFYLPFTIVTNNTVKLEFVVVIEEAIKQVIKATSETVVKVTDLLNGSIVATFDISSTKDLSAELSILKSDGGISLKSTLLQRVKDSVIINTLSQVIQDMPLPTIWVSPVEVPVTGEVIEDGTRLSDGAIAGITIGALAACALLIGLLVCIFRKANEHKRVAAFSDGSRGTKGRLTDYELYARPSA